MGINIGLDIGAISLKLAALGTPEDRPLLETLCAAKAVLPSPRLGRSGRAPPAAGDLRVPAHRGQPHPVHFRPAAGVLRDGLREADRRDTRNRLGQPDHRQDPGHLLRERIQGHRADDRRVLPAGAHGLRNRRRKLEVHPPGAAAGQRAVRHRGLRPQRRVRRGHRLVPRPAGVPDELLDRGDRLDRLHGLAARRGSRDGARCSPSRT